MKFELYPQYDAKGQRFKKPRSVGAVSLYLDMGRAHAFDASGHLVGNTAGYLKVTDVQITSDGIIVTGLEEYKADHWRYQQWWFRSIHEEKGEME